LPRAKEEKYLEWLERMEIPVAETATIRRFQDWLAGQITLTDPRLTALWSTVELYYEKLVPAGVTPRLIEFPWGEGLRFAIKGYRGWFGAKRMKEITGVEL